PRRGRPGTHARSSSSPRLLGAPDPCEPAAFEDATKRSARRAGGRDPAAILRPLRIRRSRRPSQRSGALHKMKLGVVFGYWGAQPPPDLLSATQEAERLGYDSVWSAESWGNDAF